TLWMPTAHSVWVVVQDPDTHNTGLAQVEVETGRSTLLTEVAQGWAGRTFGVEIAPDGSAVYLLLEAADHPPEIWHLRKGVHEPQRLCSLNPALTEVALGTSRLVEWR